MKHRLQISGVTVSSGSPGAAIADLRLTKSLCDGQQLQVGAVCPAALEVTLLEWDAPIPPGTEMTLLQEDGSPLGVFYCQSAQQKQGVTTVTAYDSLIKLEKDLGLYLASLDQWPYSLEEFAHMVCGQCGVSLAQTSFPNGDYRVEKFSAQGITGRDLMGFVGELAGGCLQADEQGIARFVWYRQSPIQLTAGGEHFCFQLTQEPFATVPIDRVQLRRTQNDVGVLYPDADSAHTYVVQGNVLVTEQTQSLAQGLHTLLAGITYTPGSVTVPYDAPVALGDIVTVEGKPFYVMQTVRAGQTLQLSCFGKAQPEDVPARNARKFQSLRGAVLELTTKVEGLTAENRDMLGNLARLSLDLSGISTQVTAQTSHNQLTRQQLTQLQQTAGGLSATVRQIQLEGVQRVENSFGVKLDGSSFTIARSDSDMHNRLDETGMYVQRGETQILKANADGVLATDVSVRNYLRVGDHARFEDYGASRTACYYC